MNSITTKDYQLEMLGHFLECNCEECDMMAEYGMWRIAYTLGYREPRYPVPVVWKPRGFKVDFDFYFQMGFINALCDALIERERRDAVSID